MKDNRQQDIRLYVAKSNDLIRRSKYTLNLQAQQIVDFALTRIKPDDVPGQWYSFSIKDYCHSHGIADDQGNTYAAIKETAKNLRDKSWWIKTEDGKYTTIAWFDKVKYSDNDGTIEYTFDSDVDKYVIDLIRTGNFTAFLLGDLNVFRSKYTYDLYQILKSYLFKDYFSKHDEKIIYYNADELKEQLGCQQYRYADFHRRALDIAVKELNEKCIEFNVTVEELHIGRKVDKLCFILTPTRAGQIIERKDKKRKQLNRTSKARQ